MSVRHGAFTTIVFGFPLVGASGAFGKFPLVAKEVFKVVVTPLSRCGGPGNFEATGDGVAAFTGAKAAVPA